MIAFVEGKMSHSPSCFNSTEYTHSNRLYSESLAPQFTTQVTYQFSWVKYRPKWDPATYDTTWAFLEAHFS